MKKGLIAPNIAEFFAIIVFVLVMIIFAVLFSWNSEKLKYSLQGEAGTADTGLVLLNILRTPTSSNENFADLLAESAKTNSFDEFTSRVKPLLEEHFYSNVKDSCWQMTIRQAGQTLYQFPENWNEECLGAELMEQSRSVYIPARNPTEDPIEVLVTIHATTLTKRSWIS